MIKSILIVCLLVLNQTAFAAGETIPWVVKTKQECPSVQEIQKGEPAPCDGVYMSPEASKAADEAMQDAEYYKNLNLKLDEKLSYSEQEINIVEQRLSLYMDQSNKLAEQLAKRESSSEFNKYVYFGLGVLATGIAVYGASQLIRR